MRGVKRCVVRVMEKEWGRRHKKRRSREGEERLRHAMELKTSVFLFQAEDGMRGLVRSRGLGDVYKRQRSCHTWHKVSCGIISIQRPNLPLEET